MEMMEVANHLERSSDRMNRHLDSNGKYVRYTSDQVEALERVYSECPKPSSLRRQQLIRDCSILAHIEPKQIKVWFQNRRCRDKQRKEASRLQSLNRKLSAMNKLLMEENDRLQKQVSQLVCENGYMKQQLTTTVVNDASCDSVVNPPHHSLRDVNSPTGLISIAEETLAEFLSKATGTAVDWVQMPGMKPGPDSVGIFAISQRCSGVAARACGLVSLEPVKIAEILKDRPSWYRDCRSLEVYTMFPAGNGGTIELVYMQTYAPTTLAPARDFWTLRYTTSLDNGSYVVCERSLSGSGAGPNPTSASQFVRAEMLSSGYLIRPCDGGGSIIHIVDHLNLEAWSVPDVLRPLYESSKVVAQKMTISALRYIRQLAQESNGELVHGLGRQPAVLRTFSQRLSRGFNDAVNGFGDDGWSTMHCDGAEDIIVAINSTKHLSNISSSLSFLGGVLCAKASMLLQTYAPTTLAPARDFWTLRYTTSLDNGSYVVCERSLSGSGAGPNPTSASQFVRAEMLSSGYLIRPCDGGGSIIHIVDHLNLEAWSVPDVLRPLYESSKVVAQKMTISALRYIRQLAQESNGELVHGLGRQPAVLRTFSQRLSRGFNDAVNGFGDDGWSTMHCDGAEDIIVAINSTKHLSNISSSLSFLGGVLCAKASMLLQNVPPAVLIQFLREHRSEWADFHVDAYSAATLKADTFAYPVVRPTRFTGSQVIMPLGHTIEHEEMLEVVRLEGHSLAQEDGFMSRDVHLLQICAGIDENAVGACSELIFAPINEMFPDDAPLVPSGFRVIPIDAKTGDGQDLITSNHRTLDLTSSLEVGPSPENASGNCSSSSSSRCILTIAFQFPFEPNLQENVAGMACQYVRSVISSVQRVAMAISPSGISSSLGSKLSPASPEAVSLAQWISQSYTHHLGSELVTIDSLGSNDSVLKLIWDRQDAILCCTLKPQPVFIFANQAGLDMLETTLVALQDITLEKIFDESGRKALCSDFAKLMQQGFACLPSGICLSTMGRHVTYEQAIAWKVFASSDNKDDNSNNNLHCLAFSFVNWSFV